MGLYPTTAPTQSPTKGGWIRGHVQFLGAGGGKHGGSNRHDPQHQKRRHHSVADHMQTGIQAHATATVRATEARWIANLDRYGTLWEASYEAPDHSTCGFSTDTYLCSTNDKLGSGVRPPKPPTALTQALAVTSQPQQATQPHRHRLNLHPYPHLQGLPPIAAVPGAQPGAYALTYRATGSMAIHTYDWATPTLVGVRECVPAVRRVLVMTEEQVANEVDAALRKSDVRSQPTTTSTAKTTATTTTTRRIPGRMDAKEREQWRWKDAQAEEDETHCGQYRSRSQCEGW